MRLDNGTRLGPYEVVAPIGAGGMGEVYEARDTRLDRRVALKVSAERFEERFEREARAISSLNHPHICTLYDVGPDYLVMELVEGATLAERLSEGPMALGEALPIARQVAEALEAAHEKGVIHRDLKPANVKLTGSASGDPGEVKVLDFGLAKMGEAARPGAAIGSDPAASPTLTIQGTRAGVILGTAAYMAPEQARGTVVDARADIWAFGCLLYELLAGKAAFGGESTTDVLAAVVRAEPDWSVLPSGTPEAVRRLLKRCLEKDRKRRLPAIGVARLEIDDALAAMGQAGPAAVGDSEGRRHPARAFRRLPHLAHLGWAMALVAAVAAGALWQAWRAPKQEVWAGVRLGGPTRAYAPRLSPDGQLLAFLAYIDELPQLGVMKPDGGSWTILTHDRDSGYIATAAWAPDGSKLYFDRFWGQPLGVYSVPPLGGEPRLLLENAYGPEPLPDGSLIVARLTDQGDNQLFRFWPASGKIEPLAAFLPSQNDVSPVLRAFPDGKEIVFWGTAGSSRVGSARMWVMDLASQTVRELAPGTNLDPAGAWCPMDVAPDGKSVFALASEGDSRLLMVLPRAGGRPRMLLSFPSSAAPFYIDTVRDGSLYTDQVSLQGGLLRFGETGGAVEETPMQWSPGALVMPDGSTLFSLTTGGKARLMQVRAGSEPRALLETGEETSVPAVTFGGSVALEIGSGDARRLAVASLRDGRVTHRYSGKVLGSSLAVSPDGNTLYYTSGGQVWAQAVAGGEPLAVGEGMGLTLDPAGRFLYVQRSRKGNVELYRIPATGGDPVQIPVPSEYHFAEAPLSPAAVDQHGRILISVISSHTFYYQPAILDPAAGTLTVIPIPIEGDTYGAGWTSGGRIAAVRTRYGMSLWRYRPVR